MKQYNLYEEQIKILMKDAFLKGVEISHLRQNEFTNSSTMDNFEKINHHFENWYKNYVYNRNELDELKEKVI